MSGFKKGDQIFVPIRWHLGNLKNTHVGDYPSIPQQPYIRASMYGVAICQNTLAIHRSASHTLELQCMASTPMYGSSMLEHSIGVVRVNPCPPSGLALY